MIELIRIDIDVNEHIWYERLSNITQIKVEGTVLLLLF
jgi:hypothetical protein